MRECAAAPLYENKRGWSIKDSMHSETRGWRGEEGKPIKTTILWRDNEDPSTPKYKPRHRVDRVCWRDAPRKRVRCCIFDTSYPAGGGGQSARGNARWKGVDEKQTRTKERERERDVRRTEGERRRTEKCCFYLAFDWNRIERRGDSENPRQKDFASAAIKLKNATVIQLRELGTHRRRDWCRLRFLIRERRPRTIATRNRGKPRAVPVRERENERERERGGEIWRRAGVGGRGNRRRTLEERRGDVVHARERGGPRESAWIWGGGRASVVVTSEFPLVPYNVELL